MSNHTLFNRLNEETHDVGTQFGRFELSCSLKDFQLQLGTFFTFTFQWYRHVLLFANLMTDHVPFQTAHVLCQAINVSPNLLMHSFIEADSDLSNCTERKG